MRLPFLKRRTERPHSGYPDWLAFEPELVPPPELMHREGITVLEDWFRWTEEWSMLLRVYGGLRATDRVLEIGCGLGRIAFGLRYLLDEGAYTGFEPLAYKVEFADRAFAASHPNFRFVHADVRNTHYHPGGSIAPTAYRFPADDASTDLVFAASVFTHMAPDNAAAYFRESARVLKDGGRCVFSFFLLDGYARERRRAKPFRREDFSFDHRNARWGEGFAMAFPDDPERMTAYSRARIAAMADGAGLRLTGEPVPGMWSGAHEAWIATQDVIVLRK